MDLPDKLSGSLLDGSARDLLERVASSAPAPGGGAVAALAGAFGAALVQMTANLTLGKPRYAAAEPLARVVLADAARARQALQACADADAAAFDGVAAAYRLPRASDQERAVRDAAIQRALAQAALVPLETAQRCRDVLRISEAAAPELSRAVISDVMVGAQLAYGGLEGAAINVEVNLAHMTDTAAANRLQASLSAVRDGAREQLARVLAIGGARLRPSR